ncbi:hypothetical protein SAMN04490248_104154 [Salinihabitans flavidus]|uniref:Uncharacterized protein n=1 Tax=Salinihabitans flavidus TaxID=569882 RepID=A0A1H8P730_9RHOB|nr:hypothetical protein SAMN04490248_104154 [Salinihabitans flavidus]
MAACPYRDTDSAGHGPAAFAAYLPVKNFDLVLGGRPAQVLAAQILLSVSKDILDGCNLSLRSGAGPLLRREE